MRILAVESSAVTASAAILTDDIMTAEYTINYKKTHSQTLLPMIAEIFKMTDTKPDDIDVIAVSVGPGSFTGLRIGVAAAKGLAWPENKPCAGVSTLEAMAWPLAHLEGDLCAVMDARRNQVYNARFQAGCGTLTRLCPDRALSLDELAEELRERKKTQILVGDGAGLCYNELTKRGLPVELAPSHLRWQSAWGVARAAEAMAWAGGAGDCRRPGAGLPPALSG